MIPASRGSGGSSAHKVYDAKALAEAMKERHGHYETLQDQLESLRDAMAGMTKLDDVLKGKGADSIKGFYQAQVDVANAWLDFVKVQLAFLKGVSAAAEDNDLGGNTIVDLDFLIEDLYRSDTRAKDIVAGQQEDLQKIFNGIKDILTLEVFDSGDFEDKIGEAEKERNDTIEKVATLDSDLTEEYKASESTQLYVGALYKELIEATSQNGTISPLNFDAKAYHSSQIYQMKDEVDKQTKDYLTFKDKQEEVRRLKEKQEEMENRPWYEKTWDTVCNFTGEITGYYDYKRAEEGIDPVTGEKLSTAERITAGAWAAAGFIPIVGWVGRIAKGGKAVYKIGKGMNAIHHTLDAYKTTKSLDYLRKSEKGIYGLLTANGLSEAVTGKDMFGNELTDEERKQSLTSGLLAFMTGGAAHAIDKGHLKLPYSQKYVKGQLAKAQATMKGMSRKIGKVEIPVPVRGPRLAAAGPDLGGFGLNMENRRLGDVWQNITAKNVEDVRGGGTVESPKGAGEGNIVNEVKEIDFGKHIIRGENGKKQLLPNTKICNQ